MGSQEPDKNVECIYLGDTSGKTPEIYAFPGYCENLEGLCPHMVIAAEYDTLRDDGIRYGTRLLASGVSCEMIVAPRVGHGFCTVKQPLTQWIHEGIAMSLRREFNLI